MRTCTNCKYYTSDGCCTALVKALPIWAVLDMRVTPIPAVVDPVSTAFICGVYSTKAIEPTAQPTTEHAPKGKRK